MSTSYTVPSGTRRGRADKILALGFPDHSRAGIQRALTAGLVTRGGVPLGKNDELRPGDVVEVAFPEARPSELKAVDIPLDVLFEDEHLLAVNKAAGMVVHPGAGTDEDTLVHALLAHCRGGLSGVGGVERPGIVHRLDRETTGVIVVAKTDEAHRALSAQFAERSLHKQYLALVEGVPRLLSGTIRKPIGRHETHRHKMSVVEEGKGRDAHTDWECVEVFGKAAALVRCTIHTGRTHQIRVHMKAAGHVLLGDVVYGWKPTSAMPAAPRVMLHAEHLVVAHPVTGDLLDLRAPTPADFRAVMDALRALPPRRS